jgi:hypothetical protein
MLNQRKPDFAAGESTGIFAEPGEDIGRKIPSLKQRERKLFVQRVIRNCSGQYFR